MPTWCNRHCVDRPSRAFRVRGTSGNSEGLDRARVFPNPTGSVSTSSDRDHRNPVPPVDLRCGSKSVSDCGHSSGVSNSTRPTAAPMAEPRARYVLRKGSKGPASSRPAPASETNTGFGGYGRREITVCTSVGVEETGRRGRLRRGVTPGDPSVSNPCRRIPASCPFPKY